MLFRPANLRRSEGRVFFCRGREYAALFVDDERARAAGANVNAQEFNGVSSVSFVILSEA